MNFDWRECEEIEERPNHWPALGSSALLYRYREGAIGFEEWRTFIEEWLQLLDEYQVPDLTSRCHGLFDTFLQQTARLILRPPAPCVFVSHQRADTRRGERVACIANHNHLNYWLDVHDPALIAVNLLPAHDPRRTVLIAVIVEIALLNSTCVIALHSSASLSSRWVPYEFGRAKSRYIRSSQAAGWFEALHSPVTNGDYLQLGVETYSEPEVLRWIAAIKGVPAVLPPTPNCRLHGTSVLV